jgi:hypothetical protein
MGMRAIRCAGRLSEPLTHFKASSRSNAVCTEPVSGVIYRCAALTEARGALVSKDIGCRYGGSKWLDTKS